jgi:hypothetical protein
MALVFQYGSNTSSVRLNSADRLCGDAKDLGLACTQAMFELDFDVWSCKNKCAAADIREGAGRVIWGVLYDIPDHLIETQAASGARKSLDAIEGQRYQRRPIDVQKPNGTPVNKVITYTVRTPTPHPALRTTFDYASHILRGLREHNAPDEYVAYVKIRVIANNPALAVALECL